MRLSIENLNFSYDDRRILKNISFEAESGEFLGILGANGCGKSTLLKNILGILTPQSGKITLNNENLSKMSTKSLAKIIGFVPQKSGLNAPFKVKDVILMGRYSHLKNAFSGYDKSDYKKVDEVMNLLEISEFKERLANSLSGGEFGKVLIARALVSEPKILLLDEPTSALDLNYAVNMLKICKHLTDELGLISFAVIHDLNLACMFCSRAVMLKKGELKYNDDIKNLYKSEILNDIYGLKCEILTHNGTPIVIAKKD